MNKQLKMQKLQDADGKQTRLVSHPAEAQSMIVGYVGLLVFQVLEQGRST
jgi:hypothetical protein